MGFYRPCCVLNAKIMYNEGAHLLNLSTNYFTMVTTIISFVNFPVSHILNLIFSWVLSVKFLIALSWNEYGFWLCEMNGFRGKNWLRGIFIFLALYAILVLWWLRFNYSEMYRRQRMENGVDLKDFEISNQFNIDNTGLLCKHIFGLIRWCILQFSSFGFSYSTMEAIELLCASF